MPGRTGGSPRGGFCRRSSLRMTGALRLTGKGQKTAPAPHRRTKMKETISGGSGVGVVHVGVEEPRRSHAPLRAQVESTAAMALLSGATLGWWRKAGGGRGELAAERGREESG